MFESLFDEGKEEGTGFITKTSASNTSISITTPRFTEDEEERRTNLVGLVNQGATCYLNSLIQTLFFTPELRDAVFNLDKKELGNLEDSEARTIPLQLQMLFAEMLLLNQAVVSTANLTDSFGWSGNEESIQSDVQELNRVLFDALEHSLHNTSAYNLFNNLYHGTTVNQIICKECGTISEREESYLDLPVAVSGYKSLHESLLDCYLNSETLNGSNQYRCEKCNKLVDAEKGAKIRDLPPILTFCLQRLIYDPRTWQRKKETCIYRFPLDLSMGAYTDKETTVCTDYELFSVIVHRGGSEGGHYHAIINDIDKLGNWTAPVAKEETSEVISNKKKAETDLLEFDSPYDLIEHVLSKQNHCVTTDKLTQLIQTETGVTWNKRYKKKYGTITKFLMDHPDLYIYEESSRKIMLLSKTDPSETSKVLDVEQVETPSQPDQHNWFSFDDRRVVPVKPSVLERYYGGKECAYMLFYRRKDLKRPEEAKDNHYYSVPEHLVKVIEQHNTELKEQREAEQEKLNTVSIKVYNSSEYKYEDGLIISKNRSVHTCYQENFDQRRTIFKLVKHLQKNLSEEEKGNIDLLKVKPLNNGVLHPLSVLSDEDDLTVAASGLTGNLGVTLMSKNKIKEHGVLMGEDHEPYSLNITYEEQQMPLTVAKSKTVQELSSLLLSELQVDPPVYLYEAQGKKDLTEISISLDVAISKMLRDKANLILSRFPLTSDDFKNSLSLLIEFETKDSTIKTVALVVEPSLTVSQFITQISENFKQQHNIEITPNTCRLRPRVKDSLSSPLFENRSLSQCHLSNGDVLRIEKGNPVTSGQIVVYYNYYEHPETYSLICRCSLTVKDTLDKMVKYSNDNSKESYYLRTTDWLGSPGDILYNNDQTLAQVKVKHGDSLIIMTGVPPPKDLISLTVYHSAAVPTSYADWLANVFETLNVSVGESQSQKLASVQVSISVEANIEELKLQLLEMFSITVESLDYLRLRSYADNLPGKIYKVPVKSLKDYKIKGQSALLMEVLNCKETLREDELILSVIQMDETGPLSGFQHVVWDTSQGSTATHLYRKLSNTYNITSTTDICIAKYKPASFEWKLIKQNTTPKSKGSAKQRKKVVIKEASLCKAPYMLQDGDVLGCFMSKQSVVWNEDAAQTEVDKTYKNKLIENKRNQRQAKVNDGIAFDTTEDSSNKTKRQKEKGITIKVGNFGKKRNNNSGGLIRRMSDN